MSKEIIFSALSEARDNNDYDWNLYFLKINRRHPNNYETHILKFKNDITLVNYKNDLINIINSFVLPNIDDVTEYDGYNSKVSCDKLSLSNDLIKEEYTYFIESILNANYDKLKSKYHGYILVGKRDNKLITFIKMANPIAKVNTKKSIYFSVDDNVLDLFSDDVLRLYLSVDSIIIDDNIYNFTHAFEGLFNLEKTMNNIKNQWLPMIITENVFDDLPKTTTLFKGLTSRMFTNINKSRLLALNDITKRNIISSIINVNLNDNKFMVSTDEDAKKVIKYLTNKIIQEKDSEEVYESSSSFIKLL